MGSYSVSCALSGLEISEQQDCLLGMIRQVGDWKDAMTFAIPPIRGTYDDYGQMRIDPDDLALAEEFGVVPDHGVWAPIEQVTLDEYLPIWFSAVAYRAVLNMPCEYDKSSVAAFASNISQRVIEAIPECNRKSDLWGQGSHITKEELREIWMSPLHSILGRVTPPIKDAAQRIAILLENDRPLDNVLEGLRRVLTVQHASYELRRPLKGQNGAYGPQWGGEHAAAHFYRAILAEAERRVRDSFDRDSGEE